MKLSKIHNFRAGIDRKGVTACGIQAWSVKDSDTEANKVDGTRIEVTDKNSQVTCKRCKPAQS